MSLAARHNAIFTRQAPVFVQSVSSPSAVTVSSYTITPTSTPINGNLIILCFGGIQTRTYTPPSGWTDICPYTVGGGTWGMFAKIASGEPSSYTINFVGGTLQGGYVFMEFSRSNSDVTPLSQVHVGKASSLTTYSYPSYDINQPQIVIAMMCPDSATNWTIDNSFSNPQSVFLQRFYVRYKIYSNPVLGESTTWTNSSGATPIQVGIARLEGLIT